MGVLQGKREVYFLLPKTYGQTAFQGKLLGVFGGFTLTEAKGAWLDPDGNAVWDEHYAYTIAVDNSTDADLARKFAIEAAREADQTCLYWRGRDGVVELVRVKPVKPFWYKEAGLVG